MLIYCDHIDVFNGYGYNLLQLLDKDPLCPRDFGLDARLQMIPHEHRDPPLYGQYGPY